MLKKMLPMIAFAAITIMASDKAISCTRFHVVNDSGHDVWVKWTDCRDIPRDEKVMPWRTRTFDGEEAWKSGRVSLATLGNQFVRGGYWTPEDNEPPFTIEYKGMEKPPVKRPE